MHTPRQSAAAPAPAPAFAPPAVAPRAGDTRDELSDDDLEQVVGGLARTWTEALRAPRA